MRWRGLPIFGLFLMLVGALMAAPPGAGSIEGDIQSAQAFGVSITLTAVAALLLTAVQAGRAGAGGARAEFDPSPF